ncbi:MAG TPA: hypothetical protein VFN44_24905, partial [Solirubrobacteraceae bacterium]|nr:hypothetical protein [Solirubrobacteraceae bacterium]
APEPAAPGGAAAPTGTPAPVGTAATGGAPRPPIPHWLFGLAMLVLLEPPALIVAWFLNTDLANGHLIAIALVGGLFISLPSLAIFGLAVMWDQRLKGGRTVTGLPPALTSARASRISAIALVVSTVALGAVLALLLGAWALVAIPPLALSLASAWLMARAPA